jgi:acyl carrier protein
LQHRRSKRGIGISGGRALSANGKVDRKQLPVPGGISDSARPEFRAAETELQQMLVEIWQDLLGQTAIGINDQFIQLGGDSIKAVRMLTMIQSRLGIDVSFRQIMTSKSIADLAVSLVQSEMHKLTTEVTMAVSI